METSNLIALGALIVAVIGLIPQFLQTFNKKKFEKPVPINEKLIDSSTPEETTEPTNNGET